MLIRTDWIQLMQKSPVKLDDIIRLSSNMEMKLHAIKQGRRNTNQLMDIRTGLNVLIRALLSLLHQDEIIKNKSDMEIFIRLQENFGRAIKILEEKEEKISSAMGGTGKGDTQFRITLTNETLSYISEMESILYGDIYYTIKRAIERKPSNAREFMYNLYEILTIHVGVFGSEGRTRGKSTSARIEPNITAKTLLSNEGQKKLENDFVTKFKGFEDLKIGESVF